MEVFRDIIVPNPRSSNMILGTKRAVAQTLSKERSSCPQSDTSAPQLSSERGVTFRSRVCCVELQSSCLIVAGLVAIITDCDTDTHVLVCAKAWTWSSGFWRRCRVILAYIRLPRRRRCVAECKDSCSRTSTGWLWLLYCILLKSRT